MRRLTGHIVRASKYPRAAVVVPLVNAEPNGPDLDVFVEALDCLIERAVQGNLGRVLLTVHVPPLCHVEVGDAPRPMGSVRLLPFDNGRPTAHEMKLLSHG